MQMKYGTQIHGDQLRLYGNAQRWSSVEIKENAEKIIEFCKTEGMDLFDAGTACSFAASGFLHRMNIIMNEDAEDTEHE